MDDGLFYLGLLTVAFDGGVESYILINWEVRKTDCRRCWLMNTCRRNTRSFGSMQLYPFGL